MGPPSVCGGVHVRRQAESLCNDMRQLIASEKRMPLLGGCVPESGITRHCHVSERIALHNNSGQVSDTTAVAIIHLAQYMGTAASMWAYRVTMGWGNLPVVFCHPLNIRGRRSRGVGHRNRNSNSWLVLGHLQQNSCFGRGTEVLCKNVYSPCDESRQKYLKKLSNRRE